MEIEYMIYCIASPQSQVHGSWNWSLVSIRRVSIDSDSEGFWIEGLYFKKYILNISLTP